MLTVWWEFLLVKNLQRHLQLRSLRELIVRVCYLFTIPKTLATGSWFINNEIIRYK